MTVKMMFSGEKGFMTKNFSLFQPFKIIKDNDDVYDDFSAQLREITVEGDRAALNKLGDELEKRDRRGDKYGGSVMASVSQAIARLQVIASDAKIKKLEKERTQCQKTIDAIGDKVKKLKDRKLPDLKPNSPELKSLGQARKRIKEIDAEIKKLKAE